VSSETPLGSSGFPPPRCSTEGRQHHRREAIEYWIKFWGALCALITTSVGIVYGVGGWVLDRQSRSVALAEHRILEGRIEEAKVDLKREMAETLGRFRAELADQHAQMREDQRETQRRIDSLTRSVRVLAQPTGALP